MATRRAASLRPAQFRHLIRVAGITGRMPERDTMLLWLTHTTGIRVTELALLEVGDVLYPSGAIRPEVYLRAEITKGCRPRNIYLTHPKCIAAVAEWIAIRLARGWGLGDPLEYQGLRPDSRIVMTHKGQAFELAFKRRELENGPEVYRACDALQQTMSRLYRQAGIKLGSSHSGRRSLAARVLAATGDMETVQTILGHQHLDHSKPYLTVDQEIIRRAFEVALP
ncbi:Tyrosine recombinase XerC [compost metagenome]